MGAPLELMDVVFLVLATCAVAAIAVRFRRRQPSQGEMANPYGARWAGRTVFNLVLAPIVVVAAIAGIAWLFT